MTKTSSTTSVKQSSRRRRALARTLVVLAAAGLFGVCLASPASADPTAVTVTVAGGSLGITVPTTANLGSRTNTVAGGTLSTALGVVVVSDARSAVAGSGWVTTAISTALTPSAGPTIPASAIGYTVGAITQVGTATYTANDPAALTGVTPALTATGITGDNSATWNPMINIAIPGGMAAGAYTGTITHSVA
jgi:hypothetical protein